MDHTYTLTNLGFVNPYLMRNGVNKTVKVEHPRTLKINDMELVVLDGEPDLPMGEEVRVWVDRWFHCESLEYIQRKEMIKQRSAEKYKQHEENIKARYTEQYLEATQCLLTKTPTTIEIKAHLDDLYKSRTEQHCTYKQFWRSRDIEIKQKSKDAYTAMTIISHSIDHVSNYVRKILEDEGITGDPAYAYSPREGGRNGFYSPGSDHFMLSAPVISGRFKRSKGDALCKTADKFWSLDGRDDGRSVTCRTCLERMIKLM